MMMFKMTLVSAVAMLVGLGPIVAARTLSSATPDAVEEDWRLVIGTPSSAATGPQITMVMSPDANPRGAFITFYLNYRDRPNWQPGGLQVTAYGASQDPAASPPVLASGTQGTEVCSLPGETITWTQRMAISDGNLNFDIIDGQSTTWGGFGQGQGNLGLAVSTSLSDLGAYKPDYSTSKSGASWQSNRVSSMVLTEVRYYSGGNLIATDSTPRTVIAAPSN